MPLEVALRRGAGVTYIRLRMSQNSGTAHTTDTSNRLPKAREWTPAIVDAGLQSFMTCRWTLKTVSMTSCVISPAKYMLIWYTCCQMVDESSWGAAATKALPRFYYEVHHSDSLAYRV